MFTQSITEFSQASSANLDGFGAVPVHCYERDCLREPKINLAFIPYAPRRKAC